VDFIYIFVHSTCIEIDWYFAGGSLLTAGIYIEW